MVRLSCFITKLVVRNPRSRSLLTVKSLPAQLDTRPFLARVFRLWPFRPDWTYSAVLGFRRIYAVLDGFSCFRAFLVFFIDPARVEVSYRSWPILTLLAQLALSWPYLTLLALTDSVMETSGQNPRQIRPVV